MRRFVAKRLRSSFPSGDWFGNRVIPYVSPYQADALQRDLARAKDAGVMMRSSPGAPFERVPLIAATGADAAANGTFEGMLFHLEKPVDYYVESNGVRSPMFTLSVVDLPTVAQLDLEYHFPAYTGLAPRKVEGGGDVAAIRGTDVQLRITPTMAARIGKSWAGYPTRAGARGRFARAQTTRV